MFQKSVLMVAERKKKLEKKDAYIEFINNLNLKAKMVKWYTR